VGLPDADRPKFMAWARNITGVRTTVGLLWRMIRGAYAMKRFLEAHLESARISGGKGLTAELVRVEKEGERLSRDEMVSMGFPLLIPRHHTPTHPITTPRFP